MQYNLADLFESVADAVPEREALVIGSTRLTYADLDARANRLAHHLERAGVVPGNHVGLHLYNGTEYVEAMLACFKIRAVPINVNYRYVDEELAYLYGDADLVGLIFDVEFVDRVRSVAPRIETLRHLIAVGSHEGVKLPDDAISYDMAVADQPVSRGFPTRSADDLFIIYTGGTTGMPKGVMWRHEDLFFAGMGGGNPVGEPVTAPEQIAEAAVDRYPLVMFPVAPLMHGAAQLATFIGFLQGSKVVLVRKFDPVEVIKVVEQEKANSLSIVGDAMARPLAEALAGPMKGTDVSSVVAISSAGAVLSPSVRDALKAVLPDYALVLNNFGASETGFQGTGVADEDARPRFEVNERTAVLGDDLRPVAPGSDQVGRVAQRRNVPLGYYNDPEKSARTFVEIEGERWVLLGDLATVEADGTIRVLGRGSVCINSGGEKVFPEEVESALKAHPAIFDAIVVGVPDPAFGQRVAAVVEVRPGEPTPTADDVAEHCRTRLARYKVPRSLVIVDQIRRSPSGKADYPWASRTAREAVQ